MKQFDYKEYSRLRSIARKRIERASQAGIMDAARIPTVAEVRASGNPAVYLNQVQRFLEAPTLREVRAGSAPVPPTFSRAPELKKLTDEQKRARRNEQKRRSKAKRAVEKQAQALGKDQKEINRRVGYLKALETVAAEWRAAGIDAGHWLGVMSPGQSKAFVEYMEYRFAQGDYTNKYVMDTFIRDFGDVVHRGFKLENIQKDFAAFLDKQKQLAKNQKKANKYGVSTDEVDSAWREFVNKGPEEKK